MAQCNCKLWLHQHRCTVNESVRRIAYAHFEDTHFPKQRHDALLFHSPFHWCKCVTGWFQKRCNSRGPFGNSRWRLRDLCFCWPTLLIFIGLKPQSNKSCWIYLIVPCFLLSWSLVQHYTILIHTYTAFWQFCESSKDVQPGCLISWQTSGTLKMPSGQTCQEAPGTQMESKSWGTVDTLREVKRDSQANPLTTLGEARDASGEGAQQMQLVLHLGRAKNPRLSWNNMKLCKFGTFCRLSARQLRSYRSNILEKP